MNCYLYEKKKITIKSVSLSDVKIYVTLDDLSSIAENGNTYFKCASMFLEVTFNSRNQSACVAICMLLFLYHSVMKMKCFLSKSFIFEIWKFSQKQILFPICEQVPLMLNIFQLVNLSEPVLKIYQNIPCILWISLKKNSNVFLNLYAESLTRS